jgi:hypothetical protein
MPFDDRDPKFERALAQHMRGGSAQATCPDAETLAAYHERNLSIDEMARWKEHISSCEACQEALALVESTENQLAEDWQAQRVPVLESLSAPQEHAASDAKRTVQATSSHVAILRRRPALLRWAIPLGAVAAGVLVFIGIYEQRADKMAPSSSAVVARREAPTTPAPMLDQLQSKVQEPNESKDKELANAERSVQKKEKAIFAAPPSRPTDGTGSGAGGGFVTPKPDYDVSANKKAAMPPPPATDISAAVSAGEAVSQNVPVRAAAPSAPPPPASMTSAGGVGGAVSGQRSRADAKTVLPSVSQSVTVQTESAAVDTTTNNMMLKQGASNELVESAGSLNGLILTPNNRVFWKLQPAGTVQLTTDGGKDWKSLETGANEDLTTGFAPSSNVCWIAGRSGTLLLTKDRGTHWSRITTPIAGDLGGVHAADAKHASIWDVTRHTSYETSDGGSTWKQTTNQ